MDCQALLQGVVFPTQGLNPGFLHCRQILYHLSHQAFISLRVSLDPSKGRVAGTVIGVLLGLLFLSVAVFCLIRFQKERRKRPKETFGGSELR